MAFNLMEKRLRDSYPFNFKFGPHAIRPNVWNEHRALFTMPGNHHALKVEIPHQSKVVFSSSASPIGTYEPLGSITPVFGFGSDPYHCIDLFGPTMWITPKQKVFTRLPPHYTVPGGDPAAAAYRSLQYAATCRHKLNGAFKSADGKMTKPVTVYLEPGNWISMTATVSFSNDIKVIDDDVLRGMAFIEE